MNIKCIANCTTMSNKRETVHHFIKVFSSYTGWVQINMLYVSEIKDFCKGNLQVVMQNGRSYLITKKHSKPIVKYLSGR